MPRSEVLPLALCLFSLCIGTTIFYQHGTTRLNVSAAARLQSPNASDAPATKKVDFRYASSMSGTDGLATVTMSPFRRETTHKQCYVCTAPCEALSCSRSRTRSARGSSSCTQTQCTTRFEEAVSPHTHDTTRAGVESAHE